MTTGTMSRASAVTSDHRKLVGIIGSGEIGRDPFDRGSWSGSSYHFFTSCDRAGLLERALGVEIPPISRLALMASRYARNRALWRSRHYLNPRYRDALTKEVGKHLRPSDFACDFLQLGAMYDVPSLLSGKTRCFSYHDGNLAQSLASPYSVKGVPPREIDVALDYERSVYHKLSHIFTMSEYLRQSFIHDFDVPSERVTTIGAGINLDTIPDVDLGKRYDRQEILFIGIDFERKGGWKLLEAFRVVQGRLRDAVLHIVGPRSLDVPRHLSAGVRYHGFLDKQRPEDAVRLRKLFRTSSVFVLPSLYEPFGIAPLESMVHQIPAVVSDAWALREIVRHGHTGALVQVGSVDNLAETLTDLLRAPDRLAVMGAAGREYVLRNHLWDRVVHRLGDTLRQAGSS